MNKRRENLIRILCEEAARFGWTQSEDTGGNLVFTLEKGEGLVREVISIIMTFGPRGGKARGTLVQTGVNLDRKIPITQFHYARKFLESYGIVA